MILHEMSEICSLRPF